MLAVILEFDVTDGMEDEFLEAWIATTELIHQHFGSLGSRLHEPKNGKFIAYAQWPSLSLYENEHDWPESTKSPREKMRSTLKIGKPTVLHKLNVGVDLLKPTPYKTITS